MEEIVTALKANNKTVYSSLYQSFFPRIEFFINQYILDIEAAKNITQDVFIELWENRDSFEPATNIHGWLFTVAKNKSISYIRKSRSKQNYIDSLRLRQLEVNCHALESFHTGNLIFDELCQQINKAIEKMPPMCSKVFTMSRMQNMRNHEIAAKLDINIKTVEAHITKALKIMKSELHDYLPILFLLLFPD